jgi:hypothetical protein
LRPGGIHPVFPTLQPGSGGKVPQSIATFGPGSNARPRRRPLAGIGIIRLRRMGVSPITPVVSGLMRLPSLMVPAAGGSGEPLLSPLRFIVAVC